METFLIVVGVIILAAIIYLNTVATIIVFKTPETVALLNFFRAMIIWLIPVIGFSIFLRITQQEFDCDLHHKFVPKFIGRWIYDNQHYTPNPNADRNYGQAVRFGASEMSKEFRDKH